MTLDEMVWTYFMLKVFIPFISIVTALALSLMGYWCYLTYRDWKS